MGCNERDPNEKFLMFNKLAYAFDINWSGAWRKVLVGAGLTALMGYTYKQNKQFDDRMDAKYPGPRAKKKQQENSEETS